MRRLPLLFEPPQLRVRSSSLRDAIGLAALAFREPASGRLGQPARITRRCLVTLTVCDCFFPAEQRRPLGSDAGVLPGLLTLLRSKLFLISPRRFRLEARGQQQALVVHQQQPGAGG
ncbi:MAG TPA: hypothetical protein PK264_08295, partial [Hyphomicrobiaceae bacterium]|nr:hypothetical protein [Hyphomicrobiaceae bacterium]